MMKAVVLSFFILGCSALKTQKTKARDAEEDPKLAEYSFKIDDQQSNKKYRLKADIQKLVQEHHTGAMKEVGPIDDYLELWYVNMKDAKDRRQCMDKQMEEMGVKPHMFKAINFFQCSRSAGQDANLVGCLTANKYGDCVARGINPQAIATHGAQGADDLARAYHIVSNACSHKRMMTAMHKQHKESKSKAKYAVLLEDDVAFDRHDFLRKIVNFAEMYDGKHNSTWQMVQIDPFGSKCDKHIVGKFEGLPVWKPRNVNMGWECSNYWGAQALLVKYDAIPDIIKHMEDHPTVPLDWLPAHLPAGLAWRANIALNPEASRSVHMRVPMPRYCEKSVKHSTIGSFRQKSMARAMALAQKSGANPLDAAKVVVDPDDAEFAQLVDKYNAYNPEGTYADWMDMKEKARADLSKYGIQ